MATKKKPDPPSPRVIVEIVDRMLRRMKAKSTMAVAKVVGQGPPDWAIDDIVATNGVEIEARHLVTLLKRARQ